MNPDYEYTRWHNPDTGEVREFNQETKTWEVVVQESIKAINIDVMEDLTDARELLARASEWMAENRYASCAALEEDIEEFLLKMCEKERVPGE